MTKLESNSWITFRITCNFGLQSRLHVISCYPAHILILIVFNNCFQHW